MRVHVIYAHPRADSFNAALHECVVTTLRTRRHDVDDLDLYGEGFQPVMSAAERGAYHAVGANLDGVASYVERLRAAEALVCCTPTWWYGMPAILKGYFERVWLPGVAFELTPKGTLRPRLTHIRRFVVVATYGSPWWFITLFMRDPGRMVLKRGVGGLLAPRTPIEYLAHYGMDRSTPATRARFLARVQRTFATF